MRFICPQSEAPGVNSHTCHVSLRTDGTPGGLPFSIPDLSTCLPWRLCSRSDGRWPWCQWNSKLNKQGNDPAWVRHWKFLFDLGQDTPTTVSCNSSATPDVLDILLTKNLVTPVYLTTCSTLSSEHLPILIDTQCRSTYLNLLDQPDFRRTNWAEFHACVGIDVHSTQAYWMRWQSKCASRNSPALFWRQWQSLLLWAARLMTLGTPHWLGFRVK